MFRSWRILAAAFVPFVLEGTGAFVIVAGLRGSGFLFLFFGCWGSLYFVLTYLDSMSGRVFRLLLLYGDYHLTSSTRGAE